jgi:hypothetical protein
MGRETAAIKPVARREWVMLRWGNLSSMKLLRGKKILPMVEVVVSMSGSWEPNTAKPNAIGSAVPKMREAPAAAMREWVMDMKPRNMGTNTIFFRISFSFSKAANFTFFF